MLKPKKAQIVEEVFKYGLVGLFSVVVLVAGYKVVNMLKEKACIAEIGEFEIDLKGMDKSVRFGAKELQSHSVPCNAEQIYFFDLDKNNDQINLRLFDEIPIMKDALNSKSNNNVFLIKDGEVKRSFYAGNLNISYPYYKCFIPNFGKLSFFIEGVAKAVKITSSEDQPECTLILVDTSTAEGERIIDEAESLGIDPVTEKLKIEFTKENVEIARKFSIKDEKTKVEIRIKVITKGKKLRDFRFYESIPKPCIDVLGNYIEERMDDGATVEIEADPLIMWYFSEMRGEKKVSYKLNKELDEQCQRLIKGLGVAQSIEDI